MKKQLFESSAPPSYPFGSTKRCYTLLLTIVPRIIGEIKNKLKNKKASKT